MHHRPKCVPDRSAETSDAIQISMLCILRYDSNQSITVRTIIVIQVIEQPISQRDLSYYTAAST